MVRGTVKWLIPMILVLIGAACGPKPIFPLAVLDTPTRHVYNGMTALDAGKIAIASREFQRAVHLNPNFAMAYAGLGLVAGYEGKFDEGRAFMELARKHASDPEQMDEVEKAFARLNELAFPPQ